jgi:hypothetical protein
VAILIWLALSIVKADHPELRAAEAVSVSVVVLTIVFAFTYLSVSRSDPASFSEKLNHTTAIYFVVVVLGTVGFGDIVARTNAARALVTFQILLDLVNAYEPARRTSARSLDPSSRLRTASTRPRRAEAARPSESPEDRAGA